MAGNSAFIPVEVRDWRGGLENLSRAGFYQWWRTNLWWTMTLMWTAIVNLILAGVLWSNQAEDTFQGGLGLYGIIVGLFVPIAVVIIMMDVIVGEKEKGTAAWVLSKPVTRTAFILSKIIPNALGIAVTTVLLPGLVAFGQLSAAAGHLLSIPGFLAAVGALCAIQFFFLTLTVMLGTFFDQGAPVIAIPLAFNFAQQMFAGIPVLKELLPWALFDPNTESSFIATLLQGQTPASWLPLLANLAFSALFIYLSIWRFEKTEL